MFWRTIVLLTMYCSAMVAADPTIETRAMEYAVQAAKGDEQAQYQLSLLYLRPDVPIKAQNTAFERLRALAKRGYQPAQQTLFNVHSDPSNERFSPSRALFWYQVAKLDKVDPHLLSVLTLLESDGREEPLQHSNGFDDSAAYFWLQGLKELSVSSSRESKILAREYLMTAYSGGIDVSRWLVELEHSLFSPVINGVALLTSSNTQIDDALVQNGYESFTFSNHRAYRRLGVVVDRGVPSEVVFSNDATEVSLFFRAQSADFLNAFREDLQYSFGQMNSLDYHLWSFVGLTIEWKWLSTGVLKLSYIKKGIV